MKRLVHFAAAIVVFCLVAHVLRGNREPNDWASGAPNRALMKATPSSSAVNSSTTPVGASKSERSAATSGSAAVSPSDGVPTTEAAAFAYLQSASKQGWDLRRDGFTNTIRTLNHGSFALSGPPRDAGDAFVKFYAKGLFGVDADRIHFNREEDTDRTRLIYDQVVNGVPVYGASLSLFIEQGALTRVQNDLAPGDIEKESNAVTVAQAFDSYKATHSDGATVLLQPNSANRTILYPHAGNLIYASEFVTSESAMGTATPASFHVIYDPANQFVIQRRASAIH